MQLVTAHKILIGSAIVMFAFYGTIELRSYFLGDASALFGTAACTAAVAALAFYLRWVMRHHRRVR